MPVKAIKTLLEDIFECSVDVADTLFKEVIDDPNADYLANLTKRKKSFFAEVFSKFQETIFNKDEVTKEFFIGQVMFDENLKAFFEPI